jgi:acetyltransferase-like isoleucine patch superfamily enzyme
VHVHGGGEVRVGERVVFDTSIAPIELHVEEGATIAIGDDVYVASGTSMEAQRSICIGARACIGAFTKIIDGHFHVLEGDRHVRPAPSAVIVEDDVTIGPRCVLLPRAHVGRGSTLGAGTVVTRRFPPFAVLVGVPATVRSRNAAA